ncbi:polysaccharide export outer membrane protein [Flavobacterium sp. PL11]|jgi:polysaccharide export outer membrane protein|uniref:polysaccharide biosynthesis/export family protein n=1 Tax=Flavobacterium sp. PL11 TaxID=3071717 RepID=UPI002E0A5668|nr:polysaccharide export outer membrane protein [Flavobacterium sp. PL11]
MKKIIFFLITIFLFSCTPKKDVVYYQNIDNLPPQAYSNSYEIQIQPDDLLSIIVFAEDPEIASPFNLATTNLQKSIKSGQSGGQGAMQLYLVDADGNIEFPVLGKIKVSDLSRTDVLNMFRSKIAVYIKNPIVNIRIANFKVAIQGEVKSAGVYNIESERITLIEALSMAGDLTIYGKRDNILIIREINGVKSFNRVDITKGDFINSPFYYLAQNDVVYVEPNKNKVRAAAVNPNTTLIFSVTSILITIVSLIITITK